MKATLCTVVFGIYNFKPINNSILTTAFLIFQKLPEVALSEEMMPECLSLLCKTGDGLAHAYVKIDVKEK